MSNRPHLRRTKNDDPPRPVKEPTTPTPSPQPAKSNAVLLSGSPDNEETAATRRRSRSPSATASTRSVSFKARASRHRKPEWLQSSSSSSDEDSVMQPSPHAVVCDPLLRPADASRRHAKSDQFTGVKSVDTQAHSAVRSEGYAQNRLDSSRTDARPDSHPPTKSEGFGGRGGRPDLLFGGDLGRGGFSSGGVRSCEGLKLFGPSRSLTEAKRGSATARNSENEILIEAFGKFREGVLRSSKDGSPSRPRRRSVTADSATSWSVDTAKAASARPSGEPSIIDRVRRVGVSAQTHQTARRRIPNHVSSSLDSDPDWLRTRFVR